MEHSVPLDRLPEGLCFPAEFGDRIRYDADRRRLVFRGFMSKGDFDRLCQLSDDWPFRRQLDELFRLSVPEEPRPASPLRRLLTALAGGGLPSRPASA
jgi:hypothetical protein